MNRRTKESKKFFIILIPSISTRRHGREAKKIDGKKFFNYFMGSSCEFVYYCNHRLLSTSDEIFMNSINYLIMISFSMLLLCLQFFYHHSLIEMLAEFFLSSFFDRFLPQMRFLTFLLRQNFSILRFFWEHHQQFSHHIDAFANYMLRKIFFIFFILSVSSALDRLHMKRTRELTKDTPKTVNFFYWRKKSSC